MNPKPHLTPLWAKCLHLLPPETAHQLAITLLSVPSLVPLFAKTSPNPHHFLNPSSYLPPSLSLISRPIGLAAGFDKNAEAIRGLSLLGFGFLEAGTVTCLPQKGNPKPRLFRIPNHKALINRMGFNNKGMEIFSQNVSSLPHSLPLGINIGINKNTPSPLEDIKKLIENLGKYAHYLVLNVSSPNTPGLRKFQEPDALKPLLNTAVNARNSLEKKIPILVKISPDLSDEEIIALVACACSSHVDGFIATNTTLSRNLNPPHPLAAQQGGLSGNPLLPLANHVLKVLASHVKTHYSHLPLVIIGTGGIMSGQDVYTKIRLGAHLVQIYSSLVYYGPTLIQSLEDELVSLLKRDGFNHIKDAIGVDL